MKTIRIELPEDLVCQLKSIDTNRQKFIVDAIKEKLEQKKELAFQNRLKESADLYAELYDNDRASHEWVDSAIQDWA